MPTARLADPGNQLFVQLLVCLGFVFQGVVLERTRVQPVELSLRLRDRFLKHQLAVERFTIFDLYALAEPSP